MRPSALFFPPPLPATFEISRGSQLRNHRRIRRRGVTKRYRCLRTLSVISHGWQPCPIETADGRRKITRIHSAVRRRCVGATIHFGIVKSESPPRQSSKTKRPTCTHARNAGSALRARARAHTSSTKCTHVYAHISIYEQDGIRVAY